MFHLIKNLFLSLTQFSNLISYRRSFTLLSKSSQKYQSMDPEYVTGQINSPILELLLRQFCRTIYAPSRKS